MTLPIPHELLLARLLPLRALLQDPLEVPGHDLDESGSEGVPVAKDPRGDGALGVILVFPDQ